MSLESVGAAGYQVLSANLCEYAELLAQQKADGFRVAAYRRAADTADGLGQPVTGILATKGREAEDGKPVEIILEIAESEGVDLIVTGARGLSFAKSLVVGSVSHKVAHSSRVTCVTVHCPP